MSRTVPFLLLAAAAASAQTPCPPTPVYEPCDLEFELTGAEAAQHPNPYLSVELRAEFRAPKGQTFRLPGFWDGGRKLKVRVAPLVEGQWDYRITSNLARLSGHTGSFTATAPRTAGFVSPFNVHHFRYSKPDTPHFWMGFACYDFATMPLEAFRALVDTRAGQRFNHMCGFVLGGEAAAAQAVPGPDRISPAHFQAVDERVRYLNQKGITYDLILAGQAGHLERLFPNWRQRERYLRYLVARYAAMNITWQGLEEFETYPEGGALLKEIGRLLEQLDPYRHPRSTRAASTSASLAGDGWMNYRIYRTAEPTVYAVDQQLHPTPAVNIGPGGSAPADEEAFRRQIWNAAISGQHVCLPDLPAGDPRARLFTHLYNFFEKTRYWDLEPYFRVEGGRALALEETEYIVYQDQPAPIDLLVHRAGYDVSWFNPATGEMINEKDFKGERYTCDGPPGRSGGWVLYVRREGRKQSLARSYKLESRTPVLPAPETSKAEVPFEIQLPDESQIKAGEPLDFNATLKKSNRAIRNMQWLWTAEVPASGRGYRVLATAQFGRFVVPPDIARQFPATLHLRLAGIDGSGKLYLTDRVYTLVK